MLQEGKYTCSSDVYALAILLLSYAKAIGPTTDALVTILKRMDAKYLNAEQRMHSVSSGQHLLHDRSIVDLDTPLQLTQLLRCMTKSSQLID